MTINSALLAVAITAAALGCARAETRDRNAEAASPGHDSLPAGGAAVVPGGGPSASGEVPGTPEGGLERWVDEVRSGVAGLPELASRDPAAAKNQALQLYVTRQEYIEIYYGSGGRAVRDAALAEAVTTAESRFHDLLRILNPASGGVDCAAVRPAVGALNDQYDRVLRRARELGVDLGRLELPAGGAS